MAKLQRNLLAAALGVALLSSTGQAAKPGGKPGGGDSGGSDVCTSVGFDLDPNVAGVDTSRTYDPSQGYLNQYQFVHAGELANPHPSESARWGVTIDTWLSGPGDLFMAVGARGASRVDIYKVDRLAPSSSKKLASLGVPTNAGPLWVALNDVGGDAGPDLIVTDTVAGLGWVFLSSGYPNGTTTFNDVPTANLTPQFDSFVLTAGDFGRKAIEYHEPSNALYIGDRFSDTAIGPGGAIFRCDLSALSSPPTSQVDIACVPQPLPTTASPYKGLANSMTLGDVDNDPELELLAGAIGDGKGKNAGPDRVFVYDIDAPGLPPGLTFLGELKDKGYNVNAFDYVESTTPGRDEVMATVFHAPGWVYVDATVGDTFGGDDFQLPVNPNLVHQYSNRTDAAVVGVDNNGKPLQVLAVAGAGAPEACAGYSAPNDGYVYLYVFTQGVKNPVVDTLQAPDDLGEDFGWDVAATGTDLIVIGERFATVDGLSSVGKLYFYRYVGPKSP